MDSVIHPLNDWALVFRLRVSDVLKSMTEKGTLRCLWCDRKVHLGPYGVFYFFSQQFVGNIGDADSISKHVLPVPVNSTSIRIRPLKYRAWICMRVELYGQGNHKYKLVLQSDF